MSERGLQVRLEHERIWDVRYWARRVSSKENYMNSPIPPPSGVMRRLRSCGGREDEHNSAAEPKGHRETSCGDGLRPSRKQRALALLVTGSWSQRTETLCSWRWKAQHEFMTTPTFSRASLGSADRAVRTVFEQFRVARLVLGRMCSTRRIN